MKSKILLLIILLILLSGCGKVKTLESDSDTKNMPDLSPNPATTKMEGKKALIIIAFQNYQDKEYEPTKQALENVGVQVVTASSQTGTAQGVYGGKVPINLTLDQVNASDYDVIAFIGGGGALEYVNNNLAHQIAKDAMAQNKVLAAICIAPAILAKARVLQDKQATVWASPVDKSTVNILEQNGAKFVNQDVVVDGKIITANGPAAAEEFGQKIVEVLGK